jgi:protein FAM32A
MPGDEYSSVGGGGKLKLKGGKVKDGRVDKAKKKKRTQNVEQPRPEEGKETKTAKLEDEEGALSVDKKSPALDEDINDEDPDSKRVHYKTEAERKHEERRRKRVCIILSLSTSISRQPANSPS